MKSRREWQILSLWPAIMSLSTVGGRLSIDKNDKIERVLQIYTSLMNGSIVNKAVAAAKYGVTERSIQRDIDDIRNFLELESDQSGVIRPVVYDREKKGYRLEQPLCPPAD